MFRALLVLLFLGVLAQAQVLEQVLSTEYSLAAQAAPATEILPALVPHPSQPESLSSLQQPVLRFGLQVDDLLKLRSAKENTDLRLNRESLTVMGTNDVPRLGPFTYAAEWLHTSGDEYRQTNRSLLEMNHKADSLRLTAFREGTAGSFMAAQVQLGRADIDGRTSLLKQFMKSSPIKPFSIDGSSNQFTLSYGQRELEGKVGYAVRVGWRTLDIPLAIYGTTNRTLLDFTGDGVTWEARAWRNWLAEGVEGGLLVAGQQCSGPGDVRFNNTWQGKTDSSYRSSSYGVAGRWQYSPNVYVTTELVRVSSTLNGDAYMIFPSDDDFADYLGGTGVVKSFLDASATSLHIGWQMDRQPYVFRAGYQLALIDVDAGFRYHTQFLGGGVRNQTGEELSIDNGRLHILAAGVERTFRWGRIGYALALTAPQHIARKRHDLEPLTRAATSSSTNKDISGGMIHNLRVEWWL